MKLVVTIDTEEDNWARYSATVNPLENIGRIPDLQKIFDSCGVKPTYLITYPVATDARSVAILREILEEGKCEIGMHCHPWNTPPFEEEICPANSMLCNLPEDLQYRKLETLHRAICRHFEKVPVSFRAGRWGYGPGVARSLFRLGYRIDTSITPYYSWKRYHGPDFSTIGPKPFRFDPDRVLERDSKGALLQIPASIGYLQRNFDLCQRIHQILATYAPKRLHFLGILNRLGVLNKVWLSPELSDSRSMIKLAEVMKRNNCSCLNFTFHSTSILAGLSPFVKDPEQEEEFLNRIAKFIEYVVKVMKIKSFTLSEYEGEVSI